MAEKKSEKSEGSKGGGSASTQVTTDHDEIRKWIEERGGVPSTVKKTGDKQEAGILRVDFPGVGSENSLEEISWDEFFEKFDEKNLAFMYQEKMKDGQVSRFSKFVSRETAKEVEDKGKKNKK